MANGVLSADDQSYELPTATPETLGGIRPDGTTISANKTTGVASVIGGGGGGFPRFQMLTNTSIQMFPGVLVCVSSGDVFMPPATMVLCLRRVWMIAGACSRTHRSQPQYGC
jgi:hypothetical protein